MKTIIYTSLVLQLFFIITTNAYCDIIASDLSKDNKLFAILIDKEIILYETQTGSKLRTFQVFNDVELFPTTIFFTDNNQFIIAKDIENNGILIFNTANSDISPKIFLSPIKYSFIESMLGFDAMNIESLKYLSCNRNQLLGFNDKRSDSLNFKLLEIESNKIIQSFRTKKEFTDYSNFCFGDFSKNFICIFYKETISLYNIEKENIMWEKLLNGYILQGLKISIDESKIFTFSENTLNYFDINNNGEILYTKARLDELFDPELSPDGEYLFGNNYYGHSFSDIIVTGYGEEKYFHLFRKKQQIEYLNFIDNLLVVKHEADENPIFIDFIIDKDTIRAFDNYNSKEFKILNENSDKQSIYYSATNKELLYESRGSPNDLIYFIQNNKKHEMPLKDLWNSTLNIYRKSNGAVIYDISENKTIWNSLDLIKFEDDRSTFISVYYTNQLYYSIYFEDDIHGVNSLEIRDINDNKAFTKIIL